MSESTRLFWKWEDEEDDGEAVGPVWLIHPDGSEENWEEWSRRSVAEAHASEHGYEFVADE
jgi:hypothetical protein